MNDSSSAIPPAIQEVLPKLLRDRPATAEAIWAGAVSSAYTAATIASVLAGAAATDGKLDTPMHFLAYCDSHWWGALVGIIFPTIRANQAYSKQQKGKS